jgi:hypothetical protein
MAEIQMLRITLTFGPRRVETEPLAGIIGADLPIDNVAEGPTVLRFDVKDCEALSGWIESWLRAVRDYGLGNAKSFTIEKLQ